MSSIYRSCSPGRVAARKLVARSLLARVLYLHLLVGEVAGQVPGIVRAGVGALADECALDSTDVRAGLLELETYGLAEVDEDARLIRLPDVAEDAGRLVDSPKVVVGWAKVLAQMPACRVRARHAAVLAAMVQEGQRHLFEAISEGIRYPFDTLSKEYPKGIDTLPNQDTDTEQHPEQDQKDTPREAAPPVPVPGLQLVPAPLVRAPRTRRQAANPGPEVARVFAAWQAERVELGLVEQPATLMSSSHAADIARPGDGEEAWLKVLRRAAENLRRDAQDTSRPARECKGAQYFTLESLARPSNRQRYLDQPFLDQPRSAPARASPRPGRGSVRVEPVADDVREEIRVFGGGDGT